jgi:uncharacterized LabA/DUF88 family protein
MEKGMAFIDAANINKSAESLGIKIDYKKFLNFIKKYFLEEDPPHSYSLIRPYYYSADDKNPKRSHFYDKLREFGYETRILEIVTTQNKEKIIQKQKGVDILLATEMLTFAFRNNYDAAILCSGDQDFLPVLKEIKDLGKRIFVFGFESSVAFKLKNEADKFCKLDDYLNDFKLAIK